MEQSRGGPAQRMERERMQNPPAGARFAYLPVGSSGT